MNRPSRPTLKVTQIAAQKAAQEPTQTATGDALHAYKSKRDFTRTPEPEDGVQSVAPSWKFVVQKHWASSLHYDFRLELDGVLKSWAVPKGPSLDPSVKRMAVQVEDHPLAYADFEGTVPAKQYGAGTVSLWDAGTWTALQDPHDGLRDGNLKFDLSGHKLHGRWALVRMNGKNERQPAWLLIKEKDTHARAAAAFSVVDEMPASVKSLGAALAPTFASTLAPSPGAALDPAPGRATTARAEPGTLVGQEWPIQAVPAELPTALAPQLATTVTGPLPNAQDWLFEIKFDGYRLLVRNDAKGARLLTRNGHDWTAKLRPLQRAFESLQLPPGWYDGEIVLLNEAGMPDFGALQLAFEARQTADVALYLFDLPYAAGHDLRSVPLHIRRRILKGLLADSTGDTVRFSEAFDAQPQDVLASACKLGLEGVIAKRRNSVYGASRSTDWVKLKCSQRQEFVIGGYTAPQGARSGFGALLLGVHDAQGLLQYVGAVGTGFTEKSLTGIKRELDAMAQSVSPFAAGPRIAGRPTWAHPTLVAEVSFGEWTRAGHIRHAVFRGLRADKLASSIVREKAQRLPSVRSSPSAPSAPSARFAPSALSAKSAPTLAAQAVRVGQQIAHRVTHPQRVIDISSGTTKLELVRFYGLVGELMLKHTQGRPASLLRAPDGVAGPLFFQKHLETDQLPGIVQLDPALDPQHPPMIQVAGKQGLLSAAQWNAIEFHTMNASAKLFERPDRMVFDLDPGEGVPWAQVQEAAQLVHAFLAQLGLRSFLKTSGGKGLHVVVPLKPLHNWDTVKGFSQAIVVHMAKTIPQRFASRSGPKNRIGKIFIDYLRNGRGATTVCAWSARARPGLGISVPVDWSELPMLRGGSHWTVKTVHDRLDVGNDPWMAYAKAARGLGAAMSALGYVPAVDNTA